MKCNVCIHHCELADGETGYCRARGNRKEELVSLSYGRATSVALDAIEKKPFYHFHPGTKILSVGSFGCNMYCPFCQNHGISWSDHVYHEALTCEKLVNTAVSLKALGNIGIAFTYNEPLIAYEYLIDCAKLAKNQGLYIVAVTNGCIAPSLMKTVLPYLDAVNIDIKSFTNAGYEQLHGDLDIVKENIRLCCEQTHVELTTLLVPGFNDRQEEIEAEAKWIASISKTIPLHLSRYFPHFHYNELPTSIALLDKYCLIAKQYLDHVYPGNC